MKFIGRCLGAIWGLETETTNAYLPTTNKHKITAVVFAGALCRTVLSTQMNAKSVFLLRGFIQTA